ncbi:MAG: flagellin [Alphaproteobacteria bacterium]
MSDITISRGVRSNLLTLQSIASNRETIQGRLASGKKVNSALDNPTNFFTAGSLNNRANDLTSLLDGMSNGTQTLQAADKGLKALTSLVNSAQAKIREGLQSASTQPTTSTSTSSVGTLSDKVIADRGFTAGAKVTVGVNGTNFDINIGASDTVQTTVDKINQVLGSNGAVTVDSSGKLNVRNNTSAALTLATTDGGSGAKTIADLFGASASGSIGSTAAAGSAANYDTYAKQYNDLLTQIDGVVKDTSFNGKNLLNGDSLDVIFNEKSSSPNKLSITGVTFNAAGLGLTTLANTGSTASNFNTKLTNLQDALTSLRDQSSKFGSNLSVVQTRQDFTKELANVLKTGADNLTLADQNEEGANLLALNTRAQLATSALSFASQGDQQVLQFLR